MLTAKGKRDYELILNAKKGDQRAYEQLMNLYSKSIFFEINKLVKDEEQANDLMLESMAKAFEQIDSYEPKFAFSTWIKRISVNHTIDSLRKKKLNTVSLDVAQEEVSEVKEASFESAELTPDMMMVRDEKYQALHGFISNLKGIYKELIQLRYFGELSYAEISVKTSLPEGTVKARLHRAKGMLKDMMSDSQFAMSY